jgi:long-chain fatty acid transport protein
MQTRLARVVLAAALAALTLPAHLLATDGYFSHGYGTEQKAMAGAGVALWFGPMDVANNPAAGVFGGPGVDFGVAAFNPDRQFTVAGSPSGMPGTFPLAPGTVKSGSKWFANPHAAVMWRLNPTTAFGIAMYGNGGMNTTYPAGVFGGSTPTGVNLMQMFFAPNVSKKFAGRHAVGASLLVGYQRFDAKGLQAFSTFSASPTHLTNNSPANSFGAGVRVGYLGELTRYLSVGASYQSKIRMSKLDNFSGLFAEQGRVNIPSNWVVGIAVKPAPVVDVALDVQQVRYSEIKSIGNPMLPNLMAGPLGGDNGAGFGWRNMTTVKVGAQYRWAHGFTWRGGYSYGRQPVPSSEVLFNILAPGVIEQHVTFGLTKALDDHKAIHVAVMRALSHDVNGPNPLEIPNQQQIKLTMNQWEYEVGYSIKF